MKQLFVLSHDAARKNAMQAVHMAPAGYVVEVKEATRNLEQNALMWALLADVADQVEWYGRTLTPEQWKDIFSAGMQRADVVPNLAGDGFVALGQRTSRLTKSEFSALCELILAFGSERGVRWTSTEAE